MPRMHDRLMSPAGHNGSSAARAVLGFVAIFFALSITHAALRDTTPARRYVEDAVVAPAAALAAVAFDDPAIHAQATRLRSERVSLNVRNGCEGTETFFLLVAALAVLPIDARRRWRALLIGTALVYVLNLVRIVVLFAALRDARAWFGVLHGVVLPVALIGVTAAFVFWQTRAAPRAP